MTALPQAVSVLVEKIRSHAYAMTIDGRLVSGADRFDVLNPATEQVVAAAPRCSDAELDEAVSAAAKAYETWRTDIDARRRALHRVADVLTEHQQLLGTIVALEQGKPREDGVGDVARSATWFRHFAVVDLGDRVVQDDDNGFVEVVHRPLGVVAAIIPWNQPMLMISWKVAPALVAGNTVVLKPSSSTPLTALMVGELLRDELPAGVLNVLSGPEPLGSKLIEHPGVRKVSFTGSTQVGIGIAEKTAKDLKRITLELGGNDAAIVLDDADPEEFAEQLFWAAFKNNGQMCALIKRLFVPEHRRAEYVDALAAIAESVRIGDPLSPDTQHGPMATAGQYRDVCRLAEETASSGATIATGGQPVDGPGYFFPPTIVTDVPDSATIVAEEQFGPILPVIGYTDVEDALARANNTSFGLAGSVWGRDLERARTLAGRFESGQASVNHHTRGILPHLPFGGAKRSGVGYENGPWGLDAFTQLQTLAGPSRQH